MRPLLAELPYRPDSAAAFAARLADRPWAVFLDSGRPAGRQGRYDILTADPATTLITRGGITEVRGPERTDLSPEDPFSLVRQALGPAADGVPGLPFCGGAIGYFGYDLARRLERLPVIATDADGIPEMAVAVYDWALVVDHEAQRTWLVGQGRDPRTRQRWADLTAQFSSPAPETRPRRFRVTSTARSNLDYQSYGAAFAAIQRYIQSGDCYQVNLAQRFTARVEGDPWAVYTRIRALSPVPFGAYLNGPGVQVLSASPECFLMVRDGWVETRPIKGTRPRAPDPRTDRALAESLRESAKDRAENLMIVDLLRNDLGKVCRCGSITVPELFRLESYPTVHHLVSTVRGQLAPGRDALDVLRAAFPGGSITGAPKLRAMEIIEELEPQRRGVYCGAIGYVGFDGAMDTNIAIRTLVHSAGRVCFWAGGGIVADSELESEYQETLDKAAAWLDALACMTERHVEG
ncbi:MAG: aminodeoxychorismate synthase, component I [Chromatiales bacterium 21-64-14]|nr:MAG: aminodeoxychorismate synthase, component I [Chromatiales bacterium 21-64-14]HQU17027.1 aminodeoxychorismate synthase component I [Gammaproteobacteria bacterium]